MPSTDHRHLYLGNWYSRQTKTIIDTLQTSSCMTDLLLLRSSSVSICNDSSWPPSNSQSKSSNNVVAESGVMGVWQTISGPLGATMGPLVAPKLPLQDRAMASGALSVLLSTSGSDVASCSEVPGGRTIGHELRRCWSTSPTVGRSESPDSQPEIIYHSSFD